MSRRSAGLNGNETLVEVGEPAGEAAQDGIEEVVVGVERLGLSGETSKANEATATPDTSIAPIRSDRRGRTAETTASAAATANSPPRTGSWRVCHLGGDQQRGQEREESRPTHEPPRSGAAEHRL